MFIYSLLLFNNSCPKCRDNSIQKYGGKVSASTLPQTSWFSDSAAAIHAFPGIILTPQFTSRKLTSDNGTEVEPGPEHTYSWYDVLVPGELKSAPGEDCSPKTVVQLAGYAREVFGSQIDRRFVHAFTICGDIMRCYLFDRAGVSISRGFHIRKSEKTFKLCIKILIGYSTMRPEQFGFDTNYTTANDEPFLPTRSLPMPTYVSLAGRRFECFVSCSIVPLSCPAALCVSSLGTQLQARSAW